MIIYLFSIDLFLFVFFVLYMLYSWYFSESEFGMFLTPSEFVFYAVFYWTILYVIFILKHISLLQISISIYLAMNANSNAV